MSAIFSGFIDFVGIKVKKDDDIFDRLSSRYTVGLLMACTALVTVYNLGGSPMKCWVPVHFTGNHMKYVNSYCWVADTYYSPMNVDFPRPDDQEGRQKVTYYQWVPFILVAQALMFYFPSIIWHGLNQRGGIDSDHILDTANCLTKAEKEESRSEILMVLCNQIHRFLGTRRRGDIGFRKKVKGLLTSSRFGSYLVILFVICKLLYITNAICQFYLLNKILTPGFSLYGLRVLHEEPEDNDSDMAVKPVFPKVTFCDVGLRRLGFNQVYAIQCTLPFNVWHEGIFKVIWYWTSFVAALSILGLLVWLFRFSFRHDRVVFVRNHLRTGKKIAVRDSDKDRLLVSDFVDNYLGQDGAFILRLVAHNTNNITTADIICKLYETWMDDEHCHRILDRHDTDDVTKVSDESLVTDT